MKKTTIRETVQTFVHDHRAPLATVTGSRVEAAALSVVLLVMSSLTARGGAASVAAALMGVAVLVCAGIGIQRTVARFAATPHSAGGGLLREAWCALVRLGQGGAMGVMTHMVAAAYVTVTPGCWLVRWVDPYADASGNFLALVSAVVALYALAWVAAAVLLGMLEDR